MLAFGLGSVFDSCPRPKIPWTLIKCFAPAAAAFTLYSLVTSAIPIGPELTAFVVGGISGLFLTAGIGEHAASTMRTSVVAVATTVMVIVTVRPLSGMTDMRPEVHQLAAAEEQMAARYRSAIDQFSTGRLTVRDLVAVIDREIMPRLQASRAHIASLRHIPDEQKQLLTAAEKYLQLRDESWRVRSKALQTGDVTMLTQAETSEVAARYALSRLQ
jgi:hypothetical protein